MTLAAQSNSIHEKVGKYDRIFNLSVNDSNYERICLKYGLSIESMNFAKRVRAVINEIFPDRVDIQFSFKKNFVATQNSYGDNLSKDVWYHFDKLEIENIIIVIHFPEFTIRNTYGREHTIRDMFFGIPIDPFGDTVSIGALLGRRTTLSQYEILRGYSHSHLSPINYPEPSYSSDYVSDLTNYKVFCTGMGGTAINRVRTSLFGKKYNEVEDDEIILLLRVIEEFLQWESVEGTPYIHMRNVIPEPNRQNIRTHASSDSVNLEGFYEKLTYLVKIGVTRVPSNISWEIDADFTLTILSRGCVAMWLSSLYDYLNNDDFGRAFYFKIDGNEYIPCNEYEYSFPEDVVVSTEEDKAIMAKSWIPFKNKKIIFKDYHINSGTLLPNITPEYEIVVNTNLLNYVIRKFQERLTELAHINGTLKRQNTVEIFS